LIETTVSELKDKVSYYFKALVEAQGVLDSDEVFVDQLEQALCTSNPQVWHRLRHKQCSAPEMV